MTADYRLLKDMIFRSFLCPPAWGAFKLTQVKPKNKFIVCALKKIFSESIRKIRNPGDSPGSSEKPGYVKGTPSAPISLPHLWMGDEAYVYSIA